MPEGHCLDIRRMQLSMLGMLEGGMTYEEIQRDYGVTREDILAVIR